ncbi:MAG TPA: alpha/beta hydrolase [Ktedonobacterales bacterium]|nr:alpha/beta hydrolase [Ktedonobacterales bacterium]
MPAITANGLRFHVVDEGAGAPVILLHGFPDTSSVWRHQIPALTAIGLRAIAPDLRGRGQTERPDRVEEYALANMVADVAALLDALEIGRAHIIGHDWGAAVAWLFASLMPQRVERLVTLSVGHPAVRAKPTLDALQKGWYRLLFLFPNAEDILRQDDWALFRTLFQGAVDVDRYVADLGQPGALTAGLNWYRANLPPESLARSAPPALPPAQAPTLGIFGTHDRYLSEEPMAQSGQCVTGPWRYERIEGAGHWIQLDAPDQVNRLIVDFLQSPAV